MNRDRQTHGSGEVRSFNRVEEGWEVRGRQMGPEGDHIAGIFDQEQNCGGVSGAAEDGVDGSER